MPYTHELAAEITAICKVALRRGFRFDRGCPVVVGDIALGRLRDPLHDDGTCAKIPRAAADRLLKWAWGPDARFPAMMTTAPNRIPGLVSASIKDTRLLIPSEPGGSEPMSTARIVEIARGLGEIGFARRLAFIAGVAIEDKARAQGAKDEL